MNLNLKNFAHRDQDGDNRSDNDNHAYDDAFPVKKWVKRALVGTFSIATLWSSFYTVAPNEMAETRMFGHVVNAQPLGSGLHFKAPFIQEVDKIAVSLQTMHVPEFSVNTVDNQKITLKLNFNYTVPKSDVYHLLYEVGNSGNKDIDDSMIPVVQDRAGRVFNQQNTNYVSANRTQIQNALETSVFDALEKQFGIQPHSLQIAEIKYSDSFVQSNDNAVTAKNEAVAETNRVSVEKARADQHVAQAKGEADSKIEQARGDAESVVLKAEAAKKSAILEGEGQSSKLKAEIAAFGSPQVYNDYLRASAQQNWNGQLPTIQGGGSGGPNIVVPFQAPAPK